jgi:hypothetical protein
MPVSINNTQIVFNDATTQTTAGITSAVTSLNGQTGAITNTDAGVIGSYFAGGLASAGATSNRNSTYAGSSLRLHNTSGGYVTFTSFGNANALSPSYAGTWRAMGNSKNSSDCGGEWTIVPNLFVRIS